MKSVFKSVIMIAGLGFILCSCSKEGNYSCKCKVNGDETTVQVYERSGKKEAKADCKKYEIGNVTDCKLVSR